MNGIEVASHIDLVASEAVHDPSLRPLLMRPDPNLVRAFILGLASRGVAEIEAKRTLTLSEVPTIARFAIVALVENETDGLIPETEALPSVIWDKLQPIFTSWAGRHVPLEEDNIATLLSGLGSAVYSYGRQHESSNRVDLDTFGEIIVSAMYME